MQATILSLFGVCMLSGICELILPQGSEGGRRMLRFLTSLAVLLLILAPFTRFLREQQDLTTLLPESEETMLEDYEQHFEKVLAQQCAEDLEAGLYKWLEAEHGIAPKNCTVLAHLAADGTLLRVDVTLSGAALLKDPHALEDAITQLLDCTVEVR